MKYLNTFEKQLALFPDYTKGYSDSLHDVGMKFIKSFSSNTLSKNKNRINNWYDAESFLRGKKFREDYLTALSESLSEDNDVSISVSENSDFHIFIPEIHKFIKYVNITNRVESDRINGAINNLKEYYYLSNLFEDLKDINNKLDLGDFIEWLKETNPYFFIEHNFIDTTFHYKLIEWVSEDEHIIWRAIKIPDRIEDLETYLQKYKGVGECWAYDENGAETHQGDLKVYNTIILRATVNPNDINWEYTLHLSLYSLSNEKEIRLKKNAVIEVDHIFIQNRNPNVQALKDKDYEYYQKVLGLDSLIASKVSKLGTSIDIELEDTIYVKV